MTFASLALLVFGCTPAESVGPPELAILLPVDGSTVDEGLIPVSLLVTNLELSFDPPPRVTDDQMAMLPRGFVELHLNGEPYAQIDQAQYALTGLSAGGHALEVEVIASDGTSFAPPLTAAVDFTVVPEAP